MKTKTRKTKAEKELDMQADTLFRKYFDCVQVRMLDIPDICKEIKDCIARGTVEEDMPGLVQKWRIHK